MTTSMTCEKLSQTVRYHHLLHTIFVVREDDVDVAWLFGCQVRPAIRDRRSFVLRGDAVSCLQCLARGDEHPPIDIPIMVRPSGSDVSGDGRTERTAYATMARAFRDTPMNIPSGVRYVVDVTGVTESLPLDHWSPPEEEDP